MHHLKVSNCISEISRILKPGGSIIFIEPLGTNPLINLYRSITPRARSKDEHPLIRKDFDLIKSKFKKIDLKFYGFLTLVFFPFYKSQNSRVFKKLVKFDQILFKYRIFQIFAWSVLIKAEKN